MINSEAQFIVLFVYASRSTHIFCACKFTHLLIQSLYGLIDFRCMPAYLSHDWFFYRFLTVLWFLVSQHRTFYAAYRFGKNNLSVLSSDHTGAPWLIPILDRWTATLYAARMNFSYTYYCRFHWTLHQILVKKILRQKSFKHPFSPFRDPKVQANWVSFAEHRSFSAPESYDVVSKRQVVIPLTCTRN